MIEEAEAIETILESTPLPSVVEIPLTEAVDRFLIEDIRAKDSYPSFAQSGMDGYAVKSANIKKDSERLRIVGKSVAGLAFNGRICDGETVRVFTGSPLPAGSDAVVMQEDVELDGEEIIISQVVSENDFVRCEGGLFCKGQRVAYRGDRIGPAHLGLLASMGIGNVRVGQLAKVGIITTGDELVDLGERSLKPDQIYNSNGPMLEASVWQAGAELIRRWHVSDNMEETSKILCEVMGWAQIILVIGGMSVGERDYVKSAFKKCGVKEHFWGVNIKPGKPLYYGNFSDDGQVFGLPGNPISALISFYLFVLPAMQLRQGALPSKLGLKCITVETSCDLVNTGNRPHYLRGRLDQRGCFIQSSGQSSHDLLGLSKSTTLVRIPGNGKINLGSMVDAYLLQ